MKRILKIIILNICFITLCLNVSADDDPCANSPEKDACSATVEFCYGDKKFEGCPFDEKKPLYQTSTSGEEFGYTVFGEYESISSVYINKDVPLERSYVVIDAKNNVGFVGCYKGDIKIEPSEVDSGSYTYNLVKSCSSGEDCYGTAYFFKLITPKKKTCTPVVEGIGLYLDENNEDFINKYNESVEDFNKKINAVMGKYNWTPSKSGSCPKYLNFNPKSDGISIDNYILSDGQDIDYEDMDEFNSILSFFTGGYNKNHQITGCTTQDTEGFKKIKECFEEKSKKIKSFTCPSDPSGYDTLVSNYNTYQTECKNKYKELYSKELIDTNSKIFLKIINEAVTERINECFPTTCNIEESKVNEAKQYLKDHNQKESCNYNESPTDIDTWDDSGKCWECCGQTGCTYKWSVTKPNTNCGERDRDKKSCYGSSNDDLCYNNLKYAYKQVGFTDTQINCMIKKDEIIYKVLNNIKKSSDKYDEETKDENKNRIPGNYSFKIPTPGGAGFGREADCSEVMKGPGYSMIHGIIRAVQLLSPVVAIVIAMITLIPAVTAKDEAGIKKASKTCVTIGVVLVVIEVMPYIVLLIGRILGYDLTCLL